MKKSIVSMVVATALAGPAFAQQPSVEVLHWWTSGGEAAALNALKTALAKQGVAWQDMPVVGGGGEAAMKALRSRVIAGNPPTAVQMLGFEVLDWAKEGVVADLNDVAAKNNWDKAVPPAVQRFSKYNGKWVAAPVNLHSTNWVWANTEVLAKAGITSEPKNFDEFIADAQKVQKAGFIAIAQGGQPWQEAILFDGVVLSTGGASYYRKAFVERDPATLKSPTTLKVFQRMAQIRKLVDKDFGGRDWNLASGMVISGKAGFQIMGDWAKGEFTKAGKAPGKDFACWRFPGTQGAVSFNTDQFVMYKLSDPVKAEAQRKLAADIMDPAFQSSFNVIKGAAPVRTDVSDAAFDDCGKKAIHDVADASKNNTLLGSIALTHAVPTSVKNAFQGIIARHFNGEIDDKTAADELVAAAAAN